MRSRKLPFWPVRTTWFAVLWGSVFCSTAAYGQFFRASPPAPEPAPKAPAPSTPEIEILRAENARALRIAQKAIEKEKEVGDAAEPAVPDATTREIELRTQLGYTLDQLKSATERETQLTDHVAQITAELNALRTAGPKEPRPFTFPLLEQVRDELAAENLRGESAKAVRSTSQESWNKAKASLAEKQSALRKAKEALQTAKSDAPGSPLENAVRLAELELQVAQETARLREAEAHIESLDEELHKLRQRYLQEKVAIVEREVSFSHADLQEQKVLLQKQQEDLQQALVWAERRGAELEQRRVEAARQLDQQTEKDPALFEKSESYRIGRRVREQEVTLLTAQLQRLARAMTVWDQRFAVATGSATIADRMRWEQETQDALDQLTREARLQSIRQEETRQDLANIDKKMQAKAGSEPAVLESIQEQRMHLERKLRAFDANNASIDASRRLQQKLLHELVGDARKLSLQDWLARAWSHLADAWNYELTSVDDRPITIGKLVSGVILLLLGVVFSRWLSRVLTDRLFARLKLSPHAVPTVQTVLFYLFVAIFALIALRMVNVPLGALAFLGGAVAIGIGFGSQNILNNFISGLILLAERPVRVRDVIQIDGMMGTVERIGGRSTWIRTGANMELIVPNSAFLQNNVVNWTMGNESIRSTITLGVAYGSQLRDVVRLLKKAADDHGQILKSPEPTVLFKDFADSALTFDLNYWIPVASLSDRLKVESDVRFMIDASFREARISIPFPQRDVHLDASQPLEVRVLPSAEKGENGQQAA